MMRKLKSQRIAWVIPLLSLCGCVTSNCDPNTAGFVSGIACETSGTYEYHEQSQIQSLGAARADLATQRARAQDAAQDAASAQNRLAMMRGQLSSMKDQDAALRRRLDRAQANDAAARARVDALRADLANHRADVERAAAAPDPGAVEALRRRQQQLLDAAASM